VTALRGRSPSPEEIDKAVRLLDETLTRARPSALDVPDVVLIGLDDEPARACHALLPAAGALGRRVRLEAGSAWHGL
jgi:hypothetical protein